MLEHASDSRGTIRFGLVRLSALALAGLVSCAAAETLRGQEVDTTVADAATDTIATAPTTTVPDGVEPLPADQERSDEEIRTELQAIFDRVPVMAEIDVAVSAGVVRLTGQAAHREAADRAAELARSRDGVVYVDDDALATLSAEARLEDVGGRLGEQVHGFLQLLPLLAVAGVIVALSGVLAWLVGRGGSRRLFPKMNPFLTGMVRRLLQVAVVIVGLILALELLDATALVGAVVGTAGLAGLAIGFAFKDIVENYLAGVILSLRQPFAKNDLVHIDGNLGKIVRLTGRETILMTPDGNHVQIPNATVFREPMLNYTRNPRRRARIDVEVAAEGDPATALDVGIGVLREMKGVVDDPAPDGLIVGYGQGTTRLAFFGWVDQRSADFGRVQSEAFRLVKSALEDAGIETPSPEYRVSFDGVPLPAEGEPPARRPPEGSATPRPAEPQRDVSVDKAVDEQIEAERRRATHQEDLLEDS